MGEVSPAFRETVLSKVVLKLERSGITGSHDLLQSPSTCIRSSPVLASC